MTGGISVKEFGVDPTIVVCSSWEVKLGRVEMRLTAGMVEDLINRDFLVVVTVTAWSNRSTIVTASNFMRHVTSGFPFQLLVTMSPQDPENAALLAHIVSQIEQNVNFLASQNYISNGDASSILTRLPNTKQNEISSRAANLNIGSRNIPPPPPPIPRSTPAQPTTTLSRALWAYNENGEVFLT